MIRAALLLLLLGATPARALLSGYDAVDDGTLNGATYATALHFLEFTETSSIAKCIEPVRQNNPTGAHVSNSLNGGPSGSHFALQLNPASGQTCYETDTFETSALQATVHFRLHQDAQPTGTSRSFADFQMGATQGCVVIEDQSAQTLTVKLAGSTVGTTSTTSGALFKNTCANDVRVGCANGGGTDSACPGSPATCNACIVATGQYCWWPDVEFTETNNLVAGTVECDLRFQGSLAINGTPTAFGGVATMTAARHGAIGAEAGAHELWMDDYKRVLGPRAYSGYVDMLGPSANTTPITFTTQNCTNPYDCIEDYLVGTGNAAFTLGTDNIATNKDGKQTNIVRYSTAGSGAVSPLTTSPNRIAGIESLLLGKSANGSGTARSLSQTFLQCPLQCSAAATNPGATCAIDADCPSGKCLPACTVGATEAFTIPQSAAFTLWDRFATTSTALGNQWSDSTLRQVGMRFSTVALHTDTVRLHAALIYVSVTAPDAPRVDYLLDHDAGKSCTCTVDAGCADVTGTLGVAKCNRGKCGKGAGDKTRCQSDSDCQTCASGGSCGSATCTPGDGLHTVWFDGDSTNGGTLSSICSDGVTICTQSDAASWDNANHDIPTGGCHGNVLLVRTCTGREAEAGNLAGYQCCDADNTCTNAACPDNCLTNGDCGTGGACSNPGVGTGVCTAGNATTMVFSGACDTTNHVCLASYSGHIANPNVPCTADADCGGLGQVCQSTATCDKTCPGGGDCPSRGSWGLDSAVYIPADTIVSSGAPGVPITQLASIGLPIVLQQTGPTFGIAPVGTGQCTCTTEEHCGGTTGTTHYCQGSTGNKLCVQGSSTQAGCFGLLTADCGAGQFCVFPRPDYDGVNMGYNDLLTFNTPNCKGVGATYLALYTSQCTQLCGATTACTTDASCNSALGVSDSACIGNITTGGHAICSASAAGRCSAGSTTPGAACHFGTDCTGGTCDGAICTGYAPSCNVTADCPAGWGSCVNGNSAWPGTNFDGFCDCGTNDVTGPCPAGYSCRDHFCRLMCTTDAQCGSSPYTCQTGLTPHVCKGRCECPSDIKTCTKDQDCANLIIAPWNGQAMGYEHGFCNPETSRCACMGIEGCAADTACRTQYNQLNRKGGFNLIADAWRRIFAEAKTLTPAGGGVPLMIPITNPQMTRACDEGRPRGDDLDQTAEMLKLKYPLVIDARVAAAQVNALTTHGDPVHYVDALSQLIAIPISNGINGLNVCTTDRSYKGVPLPFCKDNTGTFTTTACPLGTECSASQSCERKPCLCKTSGDCTANHSGTTCTVPSYATNGYGVCTGTNACGGGGICNDEMFYYVK